MSPPVQFALAILMFMSNFIAVADTSLERQAEAQLEGISQDSSYDTVRGEAEQDTAQDDVWAAGEETLPTPATASEGQGTPPEEGSSPDVAGLSDAAQASDGQSCSVRGTFTVGEPQ